MEGTANVPFEGDVAYREPIRAAVKQVYDPEIPVDIWELGLIYKVKVADDHSVRVEMTLTSPACPSAEALPVEVKERIEAIEGIERANVDIVWDPPWTPEYMSDAAKVALGMY
ncbi:MAG: iron-sulfur cluster assembly protein [bacterium]